SFTPYTSTRFPVSDSNPRSNLLSVPGVDHTFPMSGVNCQLFARVQFAMHTYPFRFPSALKDTITILVDIGDHFATAQRTLEPVDGSSISGPQVPVPLAFQKLTLGEFNQKTTVPDRYAI